jgi:Holliday junction resolvasome RuvABC DNA-binding subunit
MGYHMKEYYFYFKSDTKKEALSKTKASSLEDAIELFCETKKMKKDQFSELFSVSEVVRKKVVDK